MKKEVRGENMTWKEPIKVMFLLFGKVMITSSFPPVFHLHVQVLAMQTDIEAYGSIWKLL